MLLREKSDEDCFTFCESCSTSFPSAFAQWYFLKLRKALSERWVCRCVRAELVFFVGSAVLTAREVQRLVLLYHVQGAFS